MQPWLQPMQWRISCSRPAAAFASRSGSAIIARVMPITSACPSASSRSASASSTTRVVAISGRPGSAARTAPAGSAIAFRSTGGGGTMPTEPISVAE